MDEYLDWHQSSFRKASQLMWMGAVCFPLSLRCPGISVHSRFLSDSEQVSFSADPISVPSHVYMCLCTFFVLLYAYRRLHFELALRYELIHLRYRRPAWRRKRRRPSSPRRIVSVYWTICSRSGSGSSMTICRLSRIWSLLRKYAVHECRVVIPDE